MSYQREIVGGYFLLAHPVHVCVHFYAFFYITLCERRGRGTSYWLWVSVCSSVYLSVLLFVTLVFCIKMNKDIIKFLFSSSYPVVLVS